MSGHVRPCQSIAPGIPTNRGRSPTTATTTTVTKISHSRSANLEADTWYAAASKLLPPRRTKQFPPGRLNVTPSEWLSFVIVLVATGVRPLQLSDLSIVCAVALFCAIAIEWSEQFRQVHFRQISIQVSDAILCRRPSSAD